MSCKSFSRRESLIALGALAFVPGAARAEAGRMSVHRSATCRCCGAWAKRMRVAGFEVDEIIETDMDAVKARLGVPRDMYSCHTALIDGYLVEGHVPAQAIRQLRDERPKVVGVAAPGMPVGAPGMETGEPEIYKLYLFDSAGARPFGAWRGDKPA